MGIHPDGGTRLSPPCATDPESLASLRAAVARDKRRIAAGARPTYHATWATAGDGVVDVRVKELPLIHLFVPDVSSAGHGARVLIARTLEVDTDAFDVLVAPGQG